jgi:hypothetical protein
MMVGSSSRPQRTLSLARPAPLESGQHGFVVGWLRTVGEVLLQPKRFFSHLGAGDLRAPLAFASIALTLPLAIGELGSLQQGETPASDVWISALKILLAPVLGALWVATVQAALWQRVLRWFGSRELPLSVAARAMSYLTALAATLGVVMTLAGFAPESAPYVIAWYGSLDAVLLLSFYALVVLARGPHGLPLGRAIIAVLAFEACYAVVLFVSALACFALLAPAG